MRSGLQGGILLFIMAVALCHCTLPGPQRRGRSTLPPPSAREQWHQRVASRKARPPLADLTITYPYDGAVFPPEIAAPTFRWIDHHPDSTHWLAVLRFSDKANTVYAMTDRPQWQPDPATWAAIKARSVDAPAEVVIFGVRSAPAKMLTAEGRIAISTSRDRVDASILYRQVPLPFETGTRGLRQM